MGRYHARVYSELAGVDLVGVADIDGTRAREMAERYHTSAYTDYRSLFGKIDVVSIAVPTPLHYSVARVFLENGIHVLLEKPITNNLKQAEELFGIAHANDVVLHVGHVERFKGPVSELKRLVQEPFLIESRRMQPFNTRIRDDGVVLDLMIHDIDLILNLVNAKVKQVNAIGASIFSSDHEDVANVQLVFENGCIANITASRATQLKIRTIAVSQKDAYIFLNLTDNDIHVHRETVSESVLTDQLLRSKQTSQIERIFIYTRDDELKLELQHFLDCATNGTKRVVSIDHELYSLQIALEVLEMFGKNGVLIGQGE